VSDPVKSFRHCGDVPLLGDKPPERPPDGAGLTVRLTLVALPRPGDAPADQRLKRLVKAALRGYGFRCLKVEDLPGKK
jgi:hypothetical protein